MQDEKKQKNMNIQFSQNIYSLTFSRATFTMGFDESYFHLALNSHRDEENSGSSVKEEQYNIFSWLCHIFT